MRKAHLHGINTFQLVNHGLVVNGQKPGLPECQRELKNIA